MSTPLHRCNRCGFAYSTDRIRAMKLRTIARNIRTSAMSPPDRAWMAAQLVAVAGELEGVCPRCTQLEAGK